MKYKSPLRKLVIFFEKSRDKWKQKYQPSRKDIKSLKNKLYYQQQKEKNQSQRIETLEEETQALKASLAELEQQQLQSAVVKKKAEEIL